MSKPQPVEDVYGKFWDYLSQNQKDLILEGNFLMNDVIKHHNFTFKDYSFLIFPFAKAYEGYLKQLFHDVGFISRLDYVSDHLRLGKLMSPNLVDRLGDRSLYKQMKDHVTKEFADLVWNTWKMGRNQIFHYFPHNLKAVSLSEAEEIVAQIIHAMREAYAELKA